MATALTISDCGLRIVDSNEFEKLSDSTAPTASSLESAIVVIGRNEGDRLKRCLSALGESARSIIYVDSGSSDGSVALAQSMGADVVELDPGLPFTAARARNAGFERASFTFRDLKFIQFIDGDCELLPGWLESAERALRDDPDVAAVYGRLGERNRDASIYNRLCEVEWNLAPAGPVDACGGNAMMRARAFRDAGGFDPVLPAGEEGELCLRMRRRGGKIQRLDADMALHDAGITRWTQWWARAERFGLAAAEGAFRHGRGDERFHVRNVLKSVLTGGALPLLLVALAWPTNGWSLLGFLYYPFTAWRVAGHVRRRGVSRGMAAAFGVSVALAKFPQFIGVCRFAWRRLFRRPPSLIEYK